MSPLTIRGKDNSFGKKATPTDADIARVHKGFYKRKHGVRNSAIFSTMEDSGGRRSEVLQIKAKQLPNAKQLERLLATGEKWEILVTRKGQDEQVGETAPLRFSVEVIMRLLGYANGERAEVVRATGSRAEELFLTDNGTVLKGDSLTRLGWKAFRDAGVKNTSIHKLRSKFIKKRIRVRIDAARVHAENIGPTSNWIETILTGSAIDLNHGDPSSLRHYVDDYFAEETAQATPELLVDAEARLLETQRMQADIDSRIAKKVEVAHLLSIIDASPRREEFWDSVVRLIKEIA